jgi:hypothetical protein
LNQDDFKWIVNAARQVADEVLTPEEHLPQEPGDRARLLLCPTRDKAEAVAAELFAMTLDPTRWDVRIAGDEMLASELIELVADFQPSVTVIVTLPPGGVSHANYLVTRLRRQPTADMKVLVGRPDRP